MAKNPLTDILIRGLNKCSKFVLRDYLELCQLQNSPKTIDFANKTYSKAQENIIRFLGDYPDSETQEHLNAESKDANCKFIITPIDGMNNFERAHPFFSTNILICKQNKSGLVGIGCCIIFPVFGDIIYAWKGKGAWLETSGLDKISSQRLRVCSKKQEKIIQINDSEIGVDYGCDTYHGFLFASGRIDKLVSSNLDRKTQELLRLLITEAGGSVKFEGQKFIAENF